MPGLLDWIDDLRSVSISVLNKCSNHLKDAIYRSKISISRQVHSQLTQFYSHDLFTTYC